VTINVRVFHTNNFRDAHFDPPGTHPVTEVFRYTVEIDELAGFGLAGDLDDGDTSNDLCVCNHAWVLFNIGDDPDTYGQDPDARALDYRRRRNRSLSIGDVVAVEERYYQAASVGWEPLPDAPRVDPDGHEPTSTPYRQTAPKPENSHQ
jgi:hypothetical protein